MNRKILALVALFAVLPLSPSARAAVVTYMGALIDLGPGWRTPSVQKPLDIDGDNVLGTDGYDMVNRPAVQPDYVCDMAIVSSTYLGNPGYFSIDDPTNEGGLFQSGTMNPAPGVGVNADLFRFTVNSSVAGRRIRVGLMVDNLDYIFYNAYSLELVQTHGGQATSYSLNTGSEPFNDRVPDWIFFDIIDAKAGDAFVIQGTGGAIGSVTLAGVSFDSRIPLVVTNICDYGPGTLRGIVDAGLTDGDIIQFAPCLSGQTITLTNGPVTLTNEVLIDGSTLRPGLTLSGAGVNQVFYVVSGANVSVLDLTFTQGQAPYDGGAIYSAGGSTLQVSGCTFTSNNAVEGGAILNDGTLQVVNSTFTANTGDYGGALQCRAPATLIQCTISGNNANVTGGIYNKDTTLTVNNSIIADNTTIYNDAQDIYSESASLVLTNANLILTFDQDSNSPPASGPDPLAVDPMLDPLGNYGGPTPTMRPELGSPVIDAGAGATSLLVDQRGFPRVFGFSEDLGAVELSYNSTNAIVTTAADDFEPGSLRTTLAIVPAGFTISFAPNLSGRTIALCNGPLALSESVAIDASGLPCGLTLCGGDASQIFTVASGANVSLLCLTLAGGAASDAGGAIYTASGSGLLVARCTFVGNYAEEGGALLNDGVLEIDDSTFTGNYGAYGGALQCRNLAILVNCTIVSNTSFYGGGGIFNKNSTLALNNNIIAGNLPAADGCDIYNQLAALDFVNANLIDSSIIEDRPSAPDSGPEPLVGAPLLSPLGNYGGPTQTMPPLPGSPAVDAAAATSLSTDQRGFPRIVGIAPDLGAVEGIYNPAGPGSLTGATLLESGVVEFSFTNYTDTSFTVLTSTNVALPACKWSKLGPAVETPIGSGQFKFIDPQVASSPQRFYRVRMP